MVGFYDIAKDIVGQLDRYLGLDDRVLLLVNETFLSHLSLDENQLESLEAARQLVERLETRRLYKLLSRTIIPDDLKMSAKDATKALVNRFQQLNDDDIVITVS